MKTIILLALFFESLAFGAPTALTATSLSETPAQPFADVDQVNGNYVANPGGDLILFCRNSDNSDQATVTVTAQKTSFTVPGKGAVTKGDITMTLDAGDIEAVGDLYPFTYNDASGRVQLTFAGAASDSVTCAAIRP